VTLLASTTLAAASTRALWYATRGTGVVALLLLTLVVLLGVAGVARWRTEALPRFLVQGLHRNLTLLAVAFVAAHVVTTIADGFAPIGLQDAIFPFFSPYRPIWLGLGTVAFDLLLALTITSLLRARLGFKLWRAVHWLAYASWPIALVHSFGTGSDARVGWMALLGFGSAGLVALAALARVVTARDAAPVPRALGGAAAVITPLALLLWYSGGPGAAGWASRAGTPATLLGARAAALPQVPFAGRVRGTIAQSTRRAGLVTVTIALASGSRRVNVQLLGAPLSGGGVRASASAVSLGTTAVPHLYVGQIDSLSGSRLHAVLADAAGQRLGLTLSLKIDRAHGSVAGTMRGAEVRG